MGIRFYSWPRSSGTKVHWALEEVGQPYESVVLDRARGEHRAPAYLAVNPNGKVPALVDGDETFFESLAILLHLGQRYGVDRGLWPAGPRERAEALSWTVWGVPELQTSGMQFVYHGLDSPMSYAPDQRSRATAEYNGGQLQELLDVLERRLDGREHIMGAFSLVDVPAALSLLIMRKVGVQIEGRPRILSWLERCAARPAYARAR